MWKLESVQKAPPGDVHKFRATFINSSVQPPRRKTTLFGRRGYEDYTIHKDKDRRERYRTRHAKDLRTQDPTRAGFLSYYLLWGPSTSLSQNIRYYKYHVLK